MKSTTPRICPQCGAANTGRSLFCAECGANLNEPADPNATRPFAPATPEPNDASQPTEAYTPTWEQVWSGNEHHAEVPTTGQQTETSQSLRTPATPDATAAAQPVLMSTNSGTSRRSFYLGLIAILIIIAIALTLGWLTLIQPNL